MRFSPSSRMICVSWSLNQADWKNSYDFRTSFVTSDENSPVWSVVREMLPGCELTPRTHVHPSRVCDSRYAVSHAVTREALAGCRQDIVPFGRCSWLRCAKCFLYTIFVYGRSCTVYILSARWSSCDTSYVLSNSLESYIRYKVINSIISDIGKESTLLAISLRTYKLIGFYYFHFLVVLL